MGAPKKGGAYLGEGNFGCSLDSADVVPLAVAISPYDNTTTAPFQPATDKAVKVFWDESQFRRELESVAKLDQVLDEKDYLRYYGAYKIDLTQLDSLLPLERCRRLKSNLAKVRNSTRALFMIVMQKLGRSLDFELGTYDSIAKFIADVRPALVALRKLHAKGLVHCDVKPENLLLGPNGYEFIDWGMMRTKAELASSQFPVGGSPAFVSPVSLLRESRDVDVVTEYFETLFSSAEYKKKLYPEGAPVFDASREVSTSSKYNFSMTEMIMELGGYSDVRSFVQKWLPPSANANAGVASRYYDYIDNYSMAVILVKAFAHFVYIDRVKKSLGDADDSRFAQLETWITRLLKNQDPMTGRSQAQAATASVYRRKMSAAMLPELQARAQTLQPKTPPKKQLDSAMRRTDGNYSQSERAAMLAAWGM
jgi:serine/threonine protein kinase